MKEKTLKEKLVNEVSIEVISKSIIKEAKEIGFSKGDYLKLANSILDTAITLDTDHKTESKNILNGYSVDKKLKMPIDGEKISVRHFEKKHDSDLVKKWLKDENGRYFLLTRAAMNIYNNDELIEDDKHILGIITLPDKTPIGLLAFLDYDKEQNKAELRKLIGEPEFRSKGLGKQATKLWIRYGISNLGLHKIYLNTLQTNVRNIRLNEELGFKVEGILRDECFVDGEYKDLLRMGLVV